MNGEDIIKEYTVSAYGYRAVLTRKEDGGIFNYLRDAGSATWIKVELAPDCYRNTFSGWQGADECNMMSVARFDEAPLAYPPYLLLTDAQCAFWGVLP